MSEQPIRTSADDPHAPGMPPGLTPEGAEERSRIAASLTRDTFPATAAELVRTAESQHAEPHVLSLLRRLPASSTYDSLTDVALALGLGHEERPGGPVGP